MVKFDDKDKANTLLSIDNYFGQHEGSIAPMLLFFAGAGIPLLIWIFILINFIPFKFFIVLWLFWTGRWALKTLGKEDQKMKDWQQQREDEYKAMDDLVHINQLYPDGLIEYSNGFIAYILTGFPKGYLNDKKFSMDIEEFLNALDVYNWDLYLHNAIDEVLTENELPKLRNYKDDEVIQDRINFYEYQDEYSRTHAGLYRYSFLVFGPKSEWKNIKSYLTTLIDSEVSNCFNELVLCDRDYVNSLMNRDVCSFSDFVKMLTRKYENNDFRGSRVLWYDDKIPKKYRKKEEDSNTVKDLGERRNISNDV